MLSPYLVAFSGQGVEDFGHVCSVLEDEGVGEKLLELHPFFLFIGVVFGQEPFAAEEEPVGEVVCKIRLCLWPR